MQEHDDIYQSPDDIRPANLIGAIAGGLAGAALGAAIWAGVSHFLSIEFGLVAIVVGFLTGGGVSLGAQGAKGLPFQVLAAVIALFGYLGAKILIVLLALRDQAPDLPLLDPQTLGLIQEVMISSTDFFDLLFLGIVVYSAWAVPGHD